MRKKTMISDAGVAKLTMPVSRQRDHIQGEHSAQVTLVEYGDYECPYCGQAYPIVKEVQKRLRNKLRFVFRNFPITQIHLHAQNAAEAAEDAAAQNKFWDMHDYLFEHQRALDDEHLEQYAKNIQIDNIPKFKYELEQHVYAARVREDFLSGVRSGVNGTPTFFINGIRYDDSWDAESLEDAIKNIL
ncbi:MAG TPA: DsbA family protein [Nitrososphaeraceae archaeon]|jgi:protein-disulfide isomerase